MRSLAWNRRCRRAVTALRTEAALGTTVEPWLDRQRLYDLDHARAELDVSGVEPPVAAGRSPSAH